MGPNSPVSAQPSPGQLPSLLFYYDYYYYMMMVSLGPSIPTPAAEPADPWPVSSDRTEGASRGSRRLRGGLGALTEGVAVLRHRVDALVGQDLHVFPAGAAVELVGPDEAAAELIRHQALLPHMLCKIR